MPQYEFALIVASKRLAENEILDATDALGEAGCTDASLRGHAEGLELLFARSSRSLQAAISSAISAVEEAGFRVKRVEMQREAIAT